MQPTLAKSNNKNSTVCLESVWLGLVFGVSLVGPYKRYDIVFLF